jgi:hypothetical protein
MTLAETLQQKLSEWQPTDRGKPSWIDSSVETGWTIQLTADRVETLGCQIWELSLTAKECPWTTASALQTQAEAIAAKVNGLREGLKVIEVDSIRMEALLRSDKPAKRTEKVGYYELRLIAAQNRIVLKRFDAAPGLNNKREQVGFALTYEVIAKLIADLIGK